MTTKNNPQSIMRRGLIFAVMAVACTSEAAAKMVTYDLAPGQVSDPIKLKANVPTHVMGVQTNLGFRGVAGGYLLSVPGAGGFIEWAGLDSTAEAAISQGVSGTPGTKILFLDFTHCVLLEVAGTAGSGHIAIHNQCAVPAAGIIKLTN